MAKRISLGDLSRSKSTMIRSKRFPDETEDLDDALTLVFTNLRGLVAHIKGTSANLAEAQETLNEIVEESLESSNDIVLGSSKIFDGALEQAHHIENTSKAIKEVS